MNKSLRQRQKERRQRAILDAASDLIGRKGFVDTSIEEIAARAEVGIATIYNYYGSKSELLRAMLVRYIEEIAQLGETVLANPPASLDDGMVALFKTYLRGMAEKCSTRLRQEFLALAVSKELAYGKQALNLELRFLDQCNRLANHYKSIGQIRDDVTAEEAAAACYSAAVLPFAMFSFAQNADVPDIERMLQRQISIVVDGVGKRAGNVSCGAHPQQRTRRRPTHGDHTRTTDRTAKDRAARHSP